MEKDEFLKKLLLENDLNETDAVKVAKTFELLKKAGKFSAVYYRRREDKDNVVMVVITSKLYSRNAKVSREDESFKPMRRIDIKVLQALVNTVEHEKLEGVYQLPIASVVEHDGKKYYIIGASIMFGSEPEFDELDEEA